LLAYFKTLAIDIDLFVFILYSLVVVKEYWHFWKGSECSGALLLWLRHCTGEMGAATSASRCMYIIVGRLQQSAVSYEVRRCLNSNICMDVLTVLY